MSEEPADQTASAAPSDDSPPTIPPAAADVHPAAAVEAPAPGDAAGPDGTETEAAEAMASDAPAAEAAQATPEVEVASDAPAAEAAPATPEVEVASDAPAAEAAPATPEAATATLAADASTEPGIPEQPSDEPAGEPIVPAATTAAAVIEPAVVAPADAEATDLPAPSAAHRGSRWRLVGGVLLLFVIAIGLGFGAAFLVPGLADVPLPSRAASATSPPPSPSPTPSSTPTARPIPSASSGPAASASATPGASGVIYVVQSGDILSSIAARYGVTVQAIVAANGLKDPNHIEPGQRLIIPLP